MVVFDKKFWRRRWDSNPRASLRPTVKVGEANFHSCSVSDFDAKNKAALAYSDFAKEVMEYGDSESNRREAKTPA